MTVQPPPPPPATPGPGPHATEAGTAQIFERGYRRYEGERLGRGSAIRAVWAQAFQRILGMRRPIWTKILPVLVVFLSYVPAIVFIGLVALTKNDPNVASALPRYSDYYKNVLLAVLLLTAFSAPDALCPIVAPACWASTSPHRSPATPTCSARRSPCSPRRCWSRPAPSC